MRRTGFLKLLAADMAAAAVLISCGQKTTADNLFGIKVAVTDSASQAVEFGGITWDVPDYYVFKSDKSDDHNKVYDSSLKNETDFTLSMRSASSSKMTAVSEYYARVVEDMQKKTSFNVVDTYDCKIAGQDAKAFVYYAEHKEKNYYGMIALLAGTGENEWLLIETDRRKPEDLYSSAGFADFVRMLTDARTAD